MPSKELCLADYVPLWRILEEDGVAAIVTPALDYVGALKVTPADVRFASEGALESFGEGLRSLIASCDDGWTLHFLYRADVRADADIADYEASTRARRGQPHPPALEAYVRSRTAFLEETPMRRTRLYLFFSRTSRTAPLGSASLGMRLPFAGTPPSEAAHKAKLSELKSLQGALTSRLGQAGLLSRELSAGQVRNLYFALLNPALDAKGHTAPKSAPLDNLFDETTLRAQGAHLREYTEGEALCLSDVTEEMGALRQERGLRRTLTLKLLPEGGTHHLSGEALTGLCDKKDGEALPFPYWLSCTVAIQSQGVARWKLNAQHNLVDGMRNLLPFLQSRSVAKDAADRAKQAGIEGLFEELSSLSSKVCHLSVSLLLEATGAASLDARTEAARAAFSRAGNSELLLEEVSQLPAFLSLLPGSGPYQFRKKTCTSRNAADFLPVFAPWRGCARATSLLWTPTHDALRFDFFDAQLPAHHGLVWADTGSGKSVTLGALTLDALASGCDAILVDNGRSWQRLTELMGGIHVDVDIKTPITPFLPFSEVASNSGVLDAEAILDVVSFLELCVRDADFAGFNKLTLQLIARAVSQAYKGPLAATPQQRPLMSDFRAAILAAAKADGAHPDDRAILENVHRRLGLFVGDELYGRFLDRPSNLRFDKQLVTFEMESVSRSPVTRSIAFATVMQAIGARAKQRGHRTLVEVDEGHAWLGADETAEKFLERCYRTMRKYGVAMWMVSQGLDDFQASKAGRAILANSAQKLLLCHATGHAEVARFFNLTPLAEAAFRGLQRKGGHYSDLLVIHGARLACARLALSPLAYWILTTSAADKELLATAKEKNPALDALSVLTHLSRRYPHGVAGHAPSARPGVAA